MNNKYILCTIFDKREKNLHVDSVNETVSNESTDNRWMVLINFSHNLQLSVQIYLSHLPQDILEKTLKSTR